MMCGGVLCYLQRLPSAQLRLWPARASSLVTELSDGIEWGGRTQTPAVAQLHGRARQACACTTHKARAARGRQRGSGGRAAGARRCRQRLTRCALDRWWQRPVELLRALLGREALPAPLALHAGVVWVAAHHAALLVQHAQALAIIGFRRHRAVHVHESEERNARSTCASGSIQCTTRRKSHPSSGVQNVREKMRGARAGCTTARSRRRAAQKGTCPVEGEGIY